MLVLYRYLNYFIFIWTVVGGSDYEFTVEVRHQDGCAVR